MARRKPALTVIVAPDVSVELNRIWRYNAEKRDERQADVWDSFLKTKIRALATSYDHARPVEDFPELKYIVAKKRTSADGHIVVFEVDLVAGTVAILHVFHTKQDWQNKL